MVLFAGTLGVLAGRRERPGWWWIVPVLAAVWANYHGSFILAPLLVGLAWLEDLRSGWPGSRRTLATLIATVLATFATPFGPGVWAYAIGLARNPAVSGRISEWQPPSVTDVPGALFWISVVVAAVALVALARRGRAIAWPALLGFAVFAALAAIAARGVAWWPAIAVVTLAPLLGPGDPAAQAPTRPARRSALNGAVAALLVVAAVAALPFWRPTDPDLHAPSGLLAQAPPGVTAALRDLATPADRVWNPQVWGSWFEFAVPEPAYAFDSRVEIFPAEAWAAGDQVAAARGDWQGVLAAAGVTIVVTEGPKSSALARALAGTPTWRLVHADDLGTVWARASE
jgi:hypothetical protein